MSLDLCNEVGDPKNFYFIYPAESATNGYLDINDAVKRDRGRTPVCMLYLTHMLGQAGAVEMMTNQTLREQHLFIIKMSNYQGTGSDAVVLRYSDKPLLNKSGEATSPNMRLFLGIMATLGLGLLGTSFLMLELKSEHEKTTTALMLIGAIALGIPLSVFAKQEKSKMKEMKNELDRSRALDAMFQKWKKPPDLLETRAVAAGHRSNESKKSRRLHMNRKNKQEFRRLHAQSLEATVAGAGTPRAYPQAKQR